MTISPLSFPRRLGQVMGSLDQMMQITPAELGVGTVMIIQMYVDDCDIFWTCADFFLATSANGL